MARPALALSILPLLVLAACGGPGNETDDAVTAKLPPAEAAEPQPEDSGPFAVLPAGQAAANEAANAVQANSVAAPPPTSTGGSLYTSLEPTSCTRVGGDAANAAAPRHRCPGSVDYMLETSGSDQRRDLAIISPGGQRAELNLSRLVPNGRLGNTAEWRRDQAGRPRAVIVRVNASPTTESDSRISNLIVTRLDSPPCVVAVIPRGPGQNEKARAAADGDRLECVKE